MIFSKQVEGKEKRWALWNLFGEKTFRDDDIGLYREEWKWEGEQHVKDVRWNVLFFCFTQVKACFSNTNQVTPVDPQPLILTCILYTLSFYWTNDEKEVWKIKIYLLALRLEQPTANPETPSFQPHPHFLLPCSIGIVSDNLSCWKWGFGTEFLGPSLFLHKTCEMPVRKHDRSSHSLTLVHTFSSLSPYCLGELNRRTLSVAFGGTIGFQ